MSYSQLILRDSAEIVWPLDDISESSSISKPINFIAENAFTYSASINTAATDLFPVPIIFGGGTALSFTSSAVGLSIPALNRFSELYNNKDSVISFWLEINSLSHEERPIFKKRGNDNIGLFIKDNYLIFKYGTSASYSQVNVDLADPGDPHHIIVSKTKTGLHLFIDGQSYSNIRALSELNKDPDHNSNNYIDFYGPSDGNWIIDSIAFFPTALSSQVAKRHYVYGLGKNVSDDVFYSRGGNLYNFSTTVTERMGDINWDYPDEWQIAELVDLYVDQEGIRPLNLSMPTFYSSDNKIDTSSDSIKFSSSAQNTLASYIEINNLQEKIGGGEYPFFVKVKLNGQLPEKLDRQKILCYGIFPENEIVNFDLFNDDGIYKIVVSTISNNSIEFILNNPLSASSVYIGMEFNAFATVYFSEQGQQIQSASFAYRDETGFGVDPLTGYFPPSSDTVIRIGSSLNYNESSVISDTVDINQFYGTFEKFIIAQSDFVASANYSYLDSYSTPRYEISYYSDESRFRAKTYGYGNFNVHMVDMAEDIDDDTQLIGANIVRFGYPDIADSNQVKIYSTLFDYEGNVIYQKTPLNRLNYLNFLNNVNIANRYIRFDFEIFTEDASFYPPRIKYFQMQTFKSTDGKTVIRDEAGPDFTISPTSASEVFLPEIRYTPTTYITEESGLKLNQTVVEFTENFSAKPLDPTIIEGLKLWLDARFINGLGKETLPDDSRVDLWVDLSDEGNDAVSISASAPVYRTQSLNLLRVNQATGADEEDLSFIIPNNSTVEASVEGSISGARGLKVIPDGSSVDSYVDITLNSASLTTAPNQTYSVVGSIKLNKPQTASALSTEARKIVIYDDNGISQTLLVSSSAADNSNGTYSLSAVFTTSASSIGSVIRLYNGSSDSSDVVYWDNIGLYPVVSGSAINEWLLPLSLNDRPSVRFNGKNMSLRSSASVVGDASLYFVGRFFNDSAIVSADAGEAGFFVNDNKYYLNGSSVSSEYNDINSFKIYSMTTSSSQTKLFVNGAEAVTASTAFDLKVTNLATSYIYVNELATIYDGGDPSASAGTIVDGGTASSTFVESLDPQDISDFFIYLDGDISAALVFEGVHDNELRAEIEKWLDESFNILEG